MRLSERTENTSKKCMTKLWLFKNVWQCMTKTSKKCMTMYDKLKMYDNVWQNSVFSKMYDNVWQNKNVWQCMTKLEQNRIFLYDKTGKNTDFWVSWPKTHFFYLTSYRTEFNYSLHRECKLLFNYTPREVKKNIFGQKRAER